MGALEMLWVCMYVQYTVPQLVHGVINIVAQVM